MGTTFLVSYRDDPNSVRLDHIEKAIRETMQSRPAHLSSNQRYELGVSFDPLQRGVELLEKGEAKILDLPLVVARCFGNLSVRFNVKREPHLTDRGSGSAQYLLGRDLVDGTCPELAEPPLRYCDPLPQVVFFGGCVEAQEESFGQHRAVREVQSQGFCFQVFQSHLGLQLRGSQVGLLGRYQLLLT